MNENKDVCELADITVSRIIEQLGDPKLLASKLVSTLGELTKQDSAEEDIGFDGAKYHATRLALELGNAKHDSDKDRRYINRIWKDLVEAFEVIQPSIENDARKAEYRKILKPRKTDPKTGRVEFYFEEVELERSEVVTDKCTHTKDGKPVIHYERVKNPKLSYWGNKVSQLVLTRFRSRLFYYVLPFCLVWFLLFLGILVYGFSDFFFTFYYAFFLLMVSAICLHMLPFFNVHNTQVAAMPTWATESESDSAVLEIMSSDQRDKNGEYLPAFKLSVYKAECPVCGGNVSTVRGRGRNKYRVLGQCSASPVEHTYSFDRATLKGVPLRSDTYLG
ncbi:hypothetical protein A3765_08440 [Oleiphilus sp. HI0130]|nr:hypothetical protein A3765_08440 [Oleiphilus sp. HI0130]